MPEQGTDQKGLGTAIHEMFKPFGGVELEIPPRELMREVPNCRDCSCMRGGHRNAEFCGF